MTLSASDRKRLAAILGMLGSDQPGERNNAANLAEKFRRDHNLTWAELLALSPVTEQPLNPFQTSPQPPQPQPHSPSPSPSHPKRNWRIRDRLNDLPIYVSFVAAIVVLILLLAISSKEIVIGLSLVSASMFAVRRSASRRSKWEFMGWLGLPLGVAVLLHHLF
jgi:hypothetical protein